jgi:hypothetical protein
MARGHSGKTLLSNQGEEEYAVDTNVIKACVVNVVDKPCVLKLI